MKDEKENPAGFCQNVLFHGNKFFAKLRRLSDIRKYFFISAFLSPLRGNPVNLFLFSRLRRNPFLFSRLFYISRLRRNP
ncbi:MAG: hypothetical protein IK010_01730 [Bacteroidales bacterium]|nr:hypothetical protein [Bacteroidales bacterium]